MEIRIYDSEMNFLGIIENHTSLLWNRKYYEPGNFEMHVPFTDSNYSLIQQGNLIWKKGSNEAGVIEYITREESSKNSQITVKGRFLSSYMDRRLIKETYTANNIKVEIAMREILSRATSIPKVELGQLKNYEDKVTFQATYKNLLTYETRLSKASNIAYRFRPDFVNKKIFFETYRGIDRSIKQSDRSRVVFSESYKNIKNAKYEENSQLYKNICYVGGQGEGVNRTIVVTGDDSLTGLDRREVFLNASDIQTSDLSIDEYKAALSQRGESALNEDTIVESFECTCEASGNFIYKDDYDLGDVVTVIKESWSLSIDLRITEVQEVYENESAKIELTFGTPLPEVISWSDDL